MDRNERKAANDRIASVAGYERATPSQLAACLFSKTQADASGRPQHEVNQIVREIITDIQAKDATP